ncbi:MAG: hypothetical protein FJ102_04035 [Deltaproteobacteria bacterium]|nr:hypothetical protein [Deltaproteobacteria bacterium]
MILFLLACWFLNAGRFEIEVVAEESDCAEAPPIRIEEIRVEQAGERFRVHPLPEPCEVDGAHFSCEMSDFDSLADMRGEGVDAVVRVDLDLWGELRAGDLAGAASWVTTCDGGDCGVIASQVPEVCATHWRWEGVRE